ncbi:oligosaccharide flippase family protein [Mycobacterium sp. NBC_00419]|uniref:oligosaccharide flippase family protein n=1 Tax=Mycobacterium sp. NBC_00419 TaxID=2975989 RepID=UPI002E23A023
MDSGTRRNIITYYLNYVVTAAASFIVSPLLLSALGPLMFGVWKSLQRYLDFATVADGRASQALKWIVASRTAHPDEDKRRDVGAAIIVWFRWLPAAALVAAGVTVAIPLLIKGIPDDARSAAYSAAAVLAGNTVLAGLLSIPDSVLTGINQGYKSMLITTAAFVASNAAMILAAFSDWPLWSLAVIVLIASIVNAALTLLVARRSVRWWGISRPTRPDLRRVFNYSTWTLGNTVVEKLLFSSELIVMSVMVGAVAVTQYTFTSLLMQFILSIALVTASGFMPTLGSQLGGSEVDAAAELARSVRHLVIAVAVLGSGTVLAFNGAFVTLWVGADQYLGTTINALLVVCGLQVALIRMDGQIIDVTMRMAPKVLAGLLITLGGIVSGCIGFAISHSLAVALVAVIVPRLAGNVAYAVLVARSIPGSAVPWRPVVLAVGFLAFSFGVGSLTGIGDLLAKVGVILIWLLVAGAAAWFGLLPRTTVRALLTRSG